MNLDRSKIVAIITGAIALILGIAYLTLVQLLDFRGEMVPAPQSLILPQATVGRHALIACQWEVRIHAIF